MVFHLISSLGRGGRERQLATLCHYSKLEERSFKIIIMNYVSENYVEEYGLKDNVIYLARQGCFDRFLELRKITKENNVNAQFIEYR